MEWPVTTSLLWTVGLVLFGINFGETFIPVVAVALLGIHLGFTLVPRRDNDRPGNQHAESGKEVRSGHSPASHVHDRGDHDSLRRIGRHAISWLRHRGTRPQDAPETIQQLGIPLGERGGLPEVAESEEVGSVR